MKICPVGAEFIHADRRTDGQTDVTKLTVVFRDFGNTSKTSVIAAHKISIFQKDLYRRQIYSFAATPERLIYSVNWPKNVNQLAFGTPLLKRTINDVVMGSNMFMTQYLFKFS